MGVGGDGEAPVGAAGDAHRAARVDGAAGAGGGGDREGVDGEAGRDREVGAHVGVGAGRREQAVAPGDEVVAGVGHGGDLAAVGAVVHRLRAGAADRAVVAGGVGERVGVEGEARRHVDVSRHVGVGAGVRGAPVAPSREVVVRVGHCRHRRPVGAVVDTLCGSAGDGATGARRVRQRVAVDAERGLERRIRLQAAHRVAERAVVVVDGGHRRAVEQQLVKVVMDGRSDGVLLASALANDRLTGRRDAAAGAGRDRDRVRYAHLDRGALAGLLSGVAGAVGHEDGQ